MRRTCCGVDASPNDVVRGQADFYGNREVSATDVEMLQLTRYLGEGNDMDNVSRDTHRMF